MRLPVAILFLLCAAGSASAVPPPPPGEDPDLPVMPGPVASDPFLPPPGEKPPETNVPKSELPPELQEAMRLPEDLPEVVQPGEASTIEILPGVVVESDLPAAPGARKVQPQPGDSPAAPAANVPRPENGLWYLSPPNAVKAAKVLRRPVLFFFSGLRDMPQSPSTYLNMDLLSSGKYRGYAGHHLVQVLLDYTGKLPDRKKEAMEKVRTWAKVRGFPALVIYDPDGNELFRQRGYSRLPDPRSGKLVFSNADNVMSRIEDAVSRWEAREKAIREKEEKLLAMGYRLWRSNDGNYSVRARLVDSGPAGVTLADDKDRTLRVFTERLSVFDQIWVKRKLAGENVARPADPAGAVPAVTQTAPPAEPVPAFADPAPLAAEASGAAPAVTEPVSAPPPGGGITPDFYLPVTNQAAGRK